MAIQNMLITPSSVALNHCLLQASKKGTLHWRVKKKDKDRMHF